MGNIFGQLAGMTPQGVIPDGIGSPETQTMPINGDIPYPDSPVVNLRKGGQIRQLFTNIIQNMAGGMAAASQQNDKASAQTAAFSGALMAPQQRQRQALQDEGVGLQNEARRAEIAQRKTQTAQMGSMVTLPNGVQVPFALAQKLWPEYVKQQGAMDRTNRQGEIRTGLQNDQQEFVAGDHEKNRTFKAGEDEKNLAFKKESLAQQMRMAQMRNKIAEARTNMALQRLTMSSGKVTSAVQNRAALSDNIEENLSVMEDIAQRRPDLFGSFDGGVITKGKAFIGTDDPDILQWKQAATNLTKSNMGMHQMRSKYGMEHDLPNLDFKNGVNGLSGTFSAIRKSADQFRNEPGVLAGREQQGQQPAQTTGKKVPVYDVNGKRIN
jgi:hypothetical protein